MPDCDQGDPHKDIAVVVAINNEQEALELLCVRLKAALVSLGKEYEIILIDDGSTDESFSKMAMLHQQNGCVNVVKLRRNCGQTAGLIVGMRLSNARVIITMDGDLQHDPEDLKTLLEKVDRGYDVVNGRKRCRRDTALTEMFPIAAIKRAIARSFGAESREINSSFRAYRRTALEFIQRDAEMIRFLPLFAQARGLKFCEVDIQCHQRISGRTHFGFYARVVRIIKDIRLLAAIKRGDRGVACIDPAALVAEVRWHRRPGQGKGPEE